MGSEEATVLVTGLLSFSCKDTDRNRVGAHDLGTVFQDFAHGQGHAELRVETYQGALRLRGEVLEESDVDLGL